ncbi:hypothetical protein MIR68_005802 [Amoeboaphelidium protococcarum]|nr:hypothetical protein MIR68_005802 [Amoeboaphelidium protococcarum]
MALCSQQRIKMLRSVFFLPNKNASVLVVTDLQTLKWLVYQGTRCSDQANAKEAYTNPTNQNVTQVAADIIFRYRDLIKEKQSCPKLQTLGVLPEANYINRSRIKQGHPGLTERFRRMSWEEVFSFVSDNLGEDQREVLDSFKRVFNVIKAESKLAKPFEGWLTRQSGK